MQLKKLIGDARLMNDHLLTSDIAGLTADSRNVKNGFLFAALSGVQMDGAHFVGEAIDRGAAAILADPRVCSEWIDVATKKGVAVLEDPNPRRRFSLMAAEFYDGQPEHVVAVTGTNGKTSVVSFVKQIWSLLGHSAASMGTLGVDGLEIQDDAPLTTPDPVSVQQTLSQLSQSGVTHLALEASSHGLAQYRLDGVRMEAAAFTNLTQDHLDYHGDLGAYLDAKLRLFGDLLQPGSYAVLNCDAEVFADVDLLCWARGLRVMAVGEHAPKTGRHLCLESWSQTVSGQTLSIIWNGKSREIGLPLLGRFQASNALLAAGLVIACGANPEDVFAELQNLKGAPGRMQHIGTTSSGASVLVDYAHTPDALRTVLAALRSHTSGDLHVVFGAGGDRDKSKRALMGRAASEGADHVIVTDDNPRSEDPSQIRAEILSAASGAKEIGDRADAIKAAIDGLNEGDILVIAGKGHELGQIVGQKRLPFSDIEVAEEYLEITGGRV